MVILHSPEVTSQILTSLSALALASIFLHLDLKNLKIKKEKKKVKRTVDLA